MIKYERFVLDNGLRVLFHQDKRTPIANICLIYDVGSKNENVELTGIAHLFEHLMFEGSENAPDFDLPMQMAGGEDNAYTNSDFTCYYASLPVDNIETALWLEADRMENLNINAKSLEIQRAVVLEEFLETTLNKPYGKSWHYLSEMAYKNHPYRWPTIGITPEHIKQVTLEDIQYFYRSYYTPENAVLSIVANLPVEEIKELVNQMFGSIEPKQKNKKHLPVESKQMEFRTFDAPENVPLPLLYLAFKMPNRLSHDYYAIDFISDILGYGSSSRLYQKLVKEEPVFSSIHAYVTGSLDEGLWIVEGKIYKDVSIEEAEQKVWDILNELKTEFVAERELLKVKNSVESNLIYNETKSSSIAHSLSYYEILGDIERMNEEVNLYNSVSIEEIQLAAKKLFRRENCSRLRYLNVE